MKRAVPIFKFLLFLGLGGLITWLSVRGIDEESRAAIWASFDQVRWRWIALSGVFGMLSHSSRSLRWQMMLDTLPEAVAEARKTRFPNILMAVMVGYLVNMAVPRLGEVTRCGLVSRYEKISFDRVIGTVFNDRLLDVLVFGLLTVVSLILQSRIVGDYFGTIYSAVVQKIGQVDWRFLALALVVVALTVFSLRFAFRRLFTRVWRVARNVLQGVLTVFKLEKKGLFLFHTALIWFMYWAMLYACFMSSPLTDGLGPLPALVLLAFGTWGFILTPGGLGAYPLVVAGILSLYGVDYGPALGFGWLIWGCQSLFNIFAGLLSFAIFPVYNRTKAVA